jgi:riboflavin synthase
VFTGLIEEIGEITRVQESPEGRRIRIRAPKVRSGLSRGDSLSVNGVCQTVAMLTEVASVEVVAVEETLRRTTLANLAPGGRVNLERPLRLGDRLGGHWVNGHVDGTAKIEEVGTRGRDFSFRIGLPSDLARYVVEKGSIAVDGVSLTVGRVEDRSFRVHVIPETRRETLFGSYRAGDQVNLEVDVLAKYVERILGSSGADASSGWGSFTIRRTIEEWAAEAWREEPGE